MSQSWSKTKKILEQLKRIYHREPEWLKRFYEIRFQTEGSIAHEK